VQLTSAKTSSFSSINGGVCEVAAVGLDSDPEPV